MDRILQKALKRIVPCDAAEGYCYYYRGQYGFEYIPCPSVLRKTCTVSEDAILNKLISALPNEYAGITDIERLSKMEHFGIPTRLLNISSSPLVALFFCCDNIEEFNTSDGYKLDKKLSSYVFRFHLALSSVVYARYPESSLQNTTECFDQEPYVLRPFSSDSGILLSALQSLSPSKQDTLRYDAIMDFFGQCLAQHISNGYKGRTNCTYEVQQAIKLQLRYLFLGFLRQVERLPSTTTENKSDEKLTEDLRRELERKLTRNFFSSYYKIWCPKSFAVRQADYQNCLWLDVFGYRFVGELIDSGTRAIVYPTPISSEYDPIPLSLNLANDDITKNNLISFLCIEEDKMLINLETECYESWPMNELYVHIRNQYKGFLAETRPSSLLDGVFISPFLSFSRIVAQQGAFQLYGLSSFWNIRRTIVFMMKHWNRIQTKGAPLWKTAIQVIVENDLSILGHMGGGKEICPSSLIWKYVEYVHQCEIYRFKSQNRNMECKALRNELRMVGIDRATVGMDARNIFSSMKPV